ncbi:MAG: hypothetical protein NT018_13955 [Armatimonadetes bacterium]|nr:hypothetical protein [Armatimonadota bacterium]
MHRKDWVGRLLGIVIFLLGVGLLTFVFFAAYGFFSADVISARNSEPIANELGRSAINVLAKIGYLVVMTIAGSLIAGKGVTLYFASGGHGLHEEIAPEIEK